MDVYCGTLAGDVDAQSSGQERLAAESDTGGLCNAGYVYTQLSKLYGGVQLPDFQSPSGNSVKCVVFVSGSSEGGYGLFHIPGTQADFDRMVVDSLNSSGNYSSASGLGTAMAPEAVNQPHLFPMRGGDSAHEARSCCVGMRPLLAASSFQPPPSPRRPSKVSRP